jgi:4-amino-4-deoxy-L-arabinose transferase-like glycosyltransferase
LAAIGLLLTPLAFPVCPIMPGKPPMRCFYTFRTELLLSGLALLGALALFWVKTREARRVLGISLLLLAVVIFVLPCSWVLGICAHGGSACHLTVVAARIFSVLLAVSSAVVLHGNGK